MEWALAIVWFEQQQQNLELAVMRYTLYMYAQCAHVCKTSKRLCIQSWLVFFLKYR